jgi:hypothetical protein
VSADGTTIVGVGADPASQTEAWLARFSPQFGAGFLMTDSVAQSFAGQSAVTESGNHYLGGQLGTVTDVLTQNLDVSYHFGTLPYSIFAFGAYDSDPTASGNIGGTINLPYGIVVGATMGATYIRGNLVNNGNSTLQGGSATSFAARLPESGLQWIVGLTGARFNGSVDRGYLNGESPVTSSGAVRASGYGATGRLGWVLQATDKTKVTPFASYTFSQTTLDKYAETNGPFPVQFNNVIDPSQALRLGGDARYTFTPGSWFWGTLDWAHRTNGTSTTDVTGTLIGLFPITTPGITVAQDWAEVTAGVRVGYGANSALSASLTASTPGNQATTYQGRLTLSQRF